LKNPFNRGGHSQNLSSFSHLLLAKDSFASYKKLKLLLISNFGKYIHFKQLY